MLDTFLDTLTAASKHPLDVLIADNGSTDQAPQRAAERDGVRLLPTGGQPGLRPGRQPGRGRVQGDWIVLANPDVEWVPGAMDELLAAAERWPRAGALGPLIRTPAGGVYPSARELPSLARGIGHALCGWWWPANPWSRAYRQERAEPVERVAGWLSGSCLLVRRAAFESVGGFDPRYFMYFEDVDLGERLGRAGWLNIYAPARPDRAHRIAFHRAAQAGDVHRASPQRLPLPQRSLPGSGAGRRSGPACWPGWRCARRVLPPLIGLVQRADGNRESPIRHRQVRWVARRRWTRSCWSAARAPGCDR